MDFWTHSFRSQVLQQVQKEVHSLVSTQFPVVIFGAPGSGKTSWASALAKAKGHFIVVESNQAPRTLKDWRQLLSEGPAGSLIFENLEKWSDSTQNTLAQLLKENFKFNKSFICTADISLHAKVQDGQFRHDLFYRLSVRPVNLPRLLQCAEDLGPASDFWLDVHSLVAGCKKPALSQQSLEKIKSLSWRGDWAEYVSVLERALSYSQDTIQPEHLVLVQTQNQKAEVEAGLTLAEMEKKLILQTLKLTASNKSQAARLLGISIRTLRNKLNEYKQEGFHELV